MEINREFAKEDIRDVWIRLCEMQTSASSFDIRESVSEQENQLLDTIDYLARVAGMFCQLVEQELAGEMEISNPLHYIRTKLSISESIFDDYSKKNL